MPRGIVFAALRILVSPGELDEVCGLQKTLSNNAKSLFCCVCRNAPHSWEPHDVRKGLADDGDTSRPRFGFCIFQSRKADIS